MPVTLLSLPHLSYLMFQRLLFAEQLLPGFINLISYFSVLILYYIFGLPLFLQQFGSQQHEIFVIGGPRLRLASPDLFLLFVLGDSISPSLHDFLLVEGCS